MKNTDPTKTDAPLLCGYIDEADYCHQRGISRRTAQRERRLREGPPFVRLGQRTFYRIEAVQTWVRQLETLPVRRRAGRREASR